MKFLCLFILCWLTLDNVWSQEKIRSHDLTSKDRDVLDRKLSNVRLLAYSLNYAPLSYVSPPYTDLGNPKKSYLLSADIQPQFIIGGDWMPLPILLTPRFKARIFHNNPETNDTSLPVRTPSFMPGATVYIPLQDYSENTPQIKYASIAIFHHSNGQDGNEFHEDNTVNLYNGNFSTNYIEPAFHYRLRRYAVVGETTCCDPSPNYSDYYFRVGLEKHFQTAEKLKASYGDYYINFSMSWISVKNYCDNVYDKQVSKSYYREKHRIVLTATLIAGSRTHELNAINKRLNLGINYNWRIPSSPNTALFLGAGYYGSDPYNIYYQQNYFYINGGLSLGFFVAPNRKGLK